MAVGDQDHGRVAMPIAAVLARAVHQAVDLALGEVAPLDCQVYDAWGPFLGCRFHAGKPCLRVSYYILFCTVVKGRKRHREANRWSRSRRGPARMGMPLNRQRGRVRAPRGGGRAKIENSSRRHPRKFGQKRFLAVRRSWRGSGWPVFGLPPWKKYRRRDRAHLVPPNVGWMQQTP